MRVIPISEGGSFSVPKTDVDAIHRLSQQTQHVELTESEDAYHCQLKDYVVGFTSTLEGTYATRPRHSIFDFGTILRMWMYITTNKINFEESGFFEGSGINFLDFIIQLFCNNMEVLLIRGLPREYKQNYGHLKTLRGKIDLKKYCLQPFRETIPCSFDNYEHQTVPNQYLKRAVNTCYQYIENDSSLHDPLRKIMYHLQNIKPLEQYDATDIKSILSYAVEQSSEYQKAMQLAYLINESLSIESISGKSPGFSFLINYNTLFEEYVGKIIQNEMLSSAHLQEEMPLASVTLENTLKNKNVIRPDIMLKYDNIKKEAEVVIDAKNKVSNVFKNQDFFQILTYCNILNSNVGILVYPSDKSKKVHKVNFEKLHTSERFYCVFLALKNEEQQHSIEYFIQQIKKIT